MSNQENPKTNSTPDIPKVPEIPGMPKVPEVPGMPGGIPGGGPGDLSSMGQMGSLTGSPDGGAPSPMQVAINYLLYTMYSLAGTLMYYPSMLANLPESTLEKSLPKQDLCMRMGLSKRVCQKKIKCLIKNCDYLDDPKGYKLDKEFKKPCNKNKKIQNFSLKKDMVGGSKTKKRRSIKNHKKYNWRDILTPDLKNVMRDEYENNILDRYIFIKNTNKKRQRQRQKQSKKNKKKSANKTKKYYGGLGALSAAKAAANVVGNAAATNNKSENKAANSTNNAAPSNESSNNANNVSANGARNMVGPTTLATKGKGSKKKVNILDEKTCKNKIDKTLCGMVEKVINYTSPDIIKDKLNDKNKILNLFRGGGDAVNKERIKSIIIDKVKLHNPELHKLIESNPQEVDKLIKDFEKKNYLMSKMIIKNPSMVEKYSDQLIPYIKSVKVPNLKSGPGGISTTYLNASASNTASNKVAVNNTNNSSLSQQQPMQNTSQESEELEESQEETEQRKILIKEYFLKKIKADSLFKLAIILKVLQQLFRDTPVTQEEIRKKNDMKEVREDVTVVFPWNFNDPTMCLSDRIKCMNAHITQTKFEREQNPELYDKCFVCKHCTLKNTAGKVWGKVISGLLSGNKTKQLAELINSIYRLLRPYIQFSFMTDKQYYLTTLISLQLASDNLELTKLNASFFLYGNNFKLKDLIIGLPPVTITDYEKLKSYNDELREHYINFINMGIADEINEIYYKSALKKYFEIEPRHYNEKLKFLKDLALKNYELIYFYKQAEIENKSEGIMEKIENNAISIDDMNLFSYFDTDPQLNNLKNNADYQNLDMTLTSTLMPQYMFLLDGRNFNKSYLSRNMNANNQLLGNITMKIL